MKSIEKFQGRGSSNLPSIFMSLRKYNYLLEEMMFDTDDE